MTGHDILLDEHVGRVLERVLLERGYRVMQAKDEFDEATSDDGLLAWCEANSVVLLSNNAKDFESLHRNNDHAGILPYYDQKLPEFDPEGLARTVDGIFSQYGLDGIENQLVDLDEWYDWLHE